MKNLIVLVFVATLAGCAAQPARRNCPPLPELKASPTPAELAGHMATIVNMYVNCAKDVN